MNSSYKCISNATTSTGTNSATGAPTHDLPEVALEIHVPFVGGLADATPAAHETASVKAGRSRIGTSIPFESFAKSSARKRWKPGRL